MIRCTAMKSAELTERASNRVAFLGKCGGPCAEALRACASYFQELDVACPPSAPSEAETAPGYDLVYVGAPAPSHDPLCWLQFARRIVGPTGRLVIDIGALDGVPGGRGAYLREYVLPVARRVGWSEGEVRLPGGLVALEGSVIVLAAARANRWQLSVQTSETLSHVLRLYRQVFRRPVSRRAWLWKYSEPAVLAVLVWRNGRLVAHYGGVPRRLQVRGRTVNAIQVADAMVAFSERGALTRHGPLVLAATTFSERHIGKGRAFEAIYGFPIGRHSRLISRLGLGEEVDGLFEVSWPPLRETDRMQRTRPFRPQTDAAAVRRLWERMRMGLRGEVIAERDLGYILRRYLTHPVNRYSIYIVEEPGGEEALALLVVRIDNERCELLDVVACPTNIEGAIIEARRLCSRVHARELRMWVAATSLWRLPKQGRTVAKHEIPVQVGKWSSVVLPGDLSGGWWITGGDTDFR